MHKTTKAKRNIKYVMLYFLKIVKEKRKFMVNSLNTLNVINCINQIKYQQNKLPNARNRFYKHIFILLFLIFHSFLCSQTINSFQQTKKENYFTRIFLNFKLDSMELIYKKNCKQVDSNYSMVDTGVYNFLNQNLKNYDFILFDEVHCNPIHQIFIANLLSKLNSNEIVFCAELFPTDNGRILKIEKNISGTEFLNYYDPTYYEIMNVTLHNKIPTYGYDDYKFEFKLLDTVEYNDSIIHVKTRFTNHFSKIFTNKKNGERTMYIGGTTSTLPDSLNRELRSFYNLKEIKEKYPNKTIIVFSAGIHSHYGYSDNLAYYLRNKYKVLSISQTKYCDCNLFTNTVVIKSKEQNCDYNLVHPSNSFDRKNKNFFLSKSNYREAITVDLRKFINDLPFNLYVFTYNDYKKYKNDAIPIDIIEIKEEKDLVNIIYPFKNSKYLMILFNDVIYKKI